MKIKKITVNKLFGIFDHEINMNLSSGITIVIGENGLGKTILLEMLEAFFNGRYKFLTSIAFDEFIVEFDDSVIWTLKKEASPQKLPYLELVQKIGKSEKRHKLIYFDDKEVFPVALEIARYLDYMKRISSHSWKDIRTGVVYNANEIVSNFGDTIRHYKDDRITIGRFHKNIDYIQSNNMLSLFDTTEMTPPNWFFERHESVNVTLIKTQRLLALDSPDEKPINTVEKYSSQISKLVKSILAQSTELSSKLERTYPNRLIERLRKPSNISDDYLNEKLIELEDKRSLLDEVGLIEIEKDTHLFKIEHSNEVVKEVLMLYVEDSFEKLQIYDDVSQKIQLFLSIINKRFKHKKLSIDRDSGFILRSTILKNDNGLYLIIPVNKLSSGEQNELILFYELLFKAAKNSLILIDEPEISLHISWQNNFIGDLIDINKLNSLDILIATHSPDIIGDNWDLKVSLKGVE